VFQHADRLSKQIQGYDVVAGTTRTLFEAGFDYPLIFTPDGRYLLFSKKKPNSIYDVLHVYRVADGAIGNTGQKVASLRDGQVLTLPAGLRERLRLRTNNDFENPNRRKR